MWFYAANHGKTYEFIMKIFKKHNSKIKALFYPIWKNYGILRAKPPITK